MLLFHILIERVEYVIHFVFSLFEYKEESMLFLVKIMKIRSEVG